MFNKDVGLTRTKAIHTLCVVGMVTLLNTFPSFTQAQSPQGVETRGMRYCEIILHKKQLNFAVYNTIFLNSCPEDLWSKITVDSIKKETNQHFVHLNGPRYFMFDKIENSSLINTKIRMLGGIAMREAGVLQLKPFELIKKPNPYVKHIVERKTTWVYDADKPVYELINPQGEVFVMQSYTTQVLPTLIESDLPTLSKKLHLPKDWTFRTGKLKQVQKVIAINHKAVVVTDDLLNAYQQAPHDLLD
jgi:hypothetical protein